MPIDASQFSQRDWRRTFCYDLPIDGQPLFETGGLVEPPLVFGRAVRRRPAEHLIQQRPQGVHVPAGIGNGPWAGLLWCHVKQRTQSRIPFVRKPRLAKIAKPRFKIRIEQYVGRFQIAMQNPAAVRMHQRLQH